MASAAVAVIMKARRDIVSYFMSQNAVSAKDAVGFEPDRRIQRRQFKRMADAGVIESAKDGKYWLNLPRYDQWQRGIRSRVKVLVGLGVAAAAVAALFAG